MWCVCAAGLMLHSFPFALVGLTHIQIPQSGKNYAHSFGFRALSIIASARHERGALFLKQLFMVHTLLTIVRKCVQFMPCTYGTEGGHFFRDNNVLSPLIIERVIRATEQSFSMQMKRLASEFLMNCLFLF